MGSASSHPAAAASELEHFGNNIYPTLARNNANQNLFLSPASIALAMSMCSVGARQETLNQMLRALEAPSIELLTKTAEQVMQIFSIADQDRHVKLKLANRLYAQNAYKLQQDYLNLVQSSFKADIKLEDFEKNGTAVVQTVNKWVEEQTNNLIRNLLSPIDVTRDTRLIIINCIYFKGTWVKQFNENETNQNADFHEANGKTSKVKLMLQRSKYPYAENRELEVQIVHLPYKTSNRDIQFVFTVILPHHDVSLDEVERKITEKPELLEEALSHKHTKLEDVLLYIPKFKMEAQFELNAVMQQLGMTDAFDGTKADFTGIANKVDHLGGLYISKIVHKAFIDVNEQGSKAAAATVVVVRTKSMSKFPKRIPILFRANHPFLFYIRERRRNLVLFNGKFVSPTATS